MIMPRGEALLLPANPLFVWGSLALALFASLLPLGRVPWLPDALVLVLLFWSLHQPLRVGIGTAFCFGLAVDVAHAALLGQHALAFVALVYLAGLVRRRVQWLSVLEQALQLAPVFFAVHGVLLVVGLLAGGTFPGFGVALAPLAECALWPLASWLLLAPQRRPPDRDRNRPI